MLDFPNAPTLNQLFQNWIWDGEKWSSYSTPNPPLVPPPSALTQRGFIAGLNMTLATTTSIAVFSGIAADSTNTVMLNLPAILTKTNGLWAQGNNAGGLDTGAIATQTWYHWYLIYNPTTLAVDVIFSATATPDAGPSKMPSGFMLYRRIGSARFTGSSQWFLFSQIGDEFIFAVTNQDVTGAAMNVGGRNLFALTVPPGIIVDALLRVTVGGGSAGAAILVTSPSENDQAASGTTTGFTVRSNGAGDGGSTPCVVRTDNQGRIGLRSTIACNGYVSTYGYIDRRGKDM